MNVALGQMARRAVRAGVVNRSRPLLRLLFGLALLEAALWAPVWLGVVFGVGALGYMAWQLRRSAATLRSMGLSLSGTARASWPAGIAVALSLAMLGLAYYNGTLHRLWGIRQWWWAVVAYAVWALVQEFMLQAFCLRMLRAAVSRMSALLLSGAVFALAHLPNPTLTFITFFAGVAFAAIYARSRNLFVVAAIHALLGLTLAVSAPDHWLYGLRVGRGFQQHSASLAANMTVR